MQVEFSADQLKMLRIAEAFVWAKAGQLILDNSNKSCWELHELCLQQYYQGMDKATDGEYTKTLNNWVNNDSRTTY
jgi:hypothetical protein